jgi:preprotein translocase subunit YajC
LGGSWVLILYVVAFIAIFYFMAIRPQQRQRRAHQALLSSLKKGDSVLMSSGIYGTVKRVDEEKNLVVVEVAKGVTMKIARSAVAQIIQDSAQARAVAPEGATPSRGKKGRAAVEEPAAEPDSEDAEVVDDSEQDYTEGDS